MERCFFWVQIVPRVKLCVLRIFEKLLKVEFLVESHAKKTSPDPNNKFSLLNFSVMVFYQLRISYFQVDFLIRWCSNKNQFDCKNNFNITHLTIWRWNRQGGGQKTQEHHERVHLSLIAEQFNYWPKITSAPYLKELCILVFLSIQNKLLIKAMGSLIKAVFLKIPHNNTRSRKYYTTHTPTTVFGATPQTSSLLSARSTC